MSPSIPNYSSLPDQTLLELYEEINSLTIPAREALVGELAKRGLIEGSKVEYKKVTTEERQIVNLNLQTSLNFTSEDYEANSRGQLTEDQRTNLVKQSKNTTLFSIIGLILFGGGPFTFLWYLHSEKHFFEDLGEPGEGWGYIIILLLAGIGVLAIFICLKQLISNIINKNPKVLEVAGPLFKREMSTQHMTSYFIRVDSAEFIVTESVYRQISKNYTYRIFYAAGSGLPLSAEVLGSTETVVV